MAEAHETIKVVEVSAAVLQRPDHSYLLAQRPPDKIWAGYWEFPGGKVEPGETAYQALVRELREELGIDVVTAYPWITRVFTYPHATVRLNFFRVTEWRGELHPHEGQQFAWQSPLAPADVSGRAEVEPILPANAPVLRALSLPQVYAISNVAELGEERFLSSLQTALENGLRLVQLREKGLGRIGLREFSERMLEMMRPYGAKLLLNADVDLAMEVGADGVQLNSRQLATLSERPELLWCGASCHSREELRHAEALGCDFAVLSPVLSTRSHPEAAPLGWEQFASLVTGASIPVYALGGMTATELKTSWQHGAHGIAMLRQAWDSGSP